MGLVLFFLEVYCVTWSVDVFARWLAVRVSPHGGGILADCGVLSILLSVCICLFFGVLLFV